MLTIHTVTSASQAKQYFNVSDYYSDGQETVGMWGGKLAERLGLSGFVDKANFDRLCDNLHPQTGEPLTPRTNDKRRVGYDFVFSGPKSFSIVEALATDEERGQLLKAFGDSVDETMAEIESDMQVRVRKNGAFHDRPTRNMVWAYFDHSTARPVKRPANDNQPPGMKPAANDNYPPDMQRHRHVFAFNATEDEVEGCIKAGEFS
jgi:conjugative relaxase-like TrwC/TraI family protein